MKIIALFIPFLILMSEWLLQVHQWIPLEPSVTYCLFMTGWMVIWWIFEIMPLGVTALIPIVFLPISQILSVKEVTPHYANPVIFLFLGGFIIARALEKTLLSQRIALVILKRTGNSDRGIILGFMLATTLMSMWISNTATTVMMVPIAMAVMSFLSENLKPDESRGLNSLAVALFLSIAYSANVGGIITPVGTPPNVVLMGFLGDLYNVNVDFWRWMAIAGPVAFVLLGFQIFVLIKLFPFEVKVDSEFQDFVEKKIRELGRLNASQKVVILVFSLTALLWVFKGVIHWAIGFQLLNDTSIAILGGILLFFIPTQRNSSPVLSQGDIAFLPWNIVLLFGGGMAMASALKHVGLIEMTTTALSGLGIESPFALVLVLASVSLLLTELMSNVALCVVALPVMMELGVKLGIHPALVGIPVAFCSSFAFSMPISTPPNAIVFGTGRVKVYEMLKAGLVLNFVGILCVMILGWSLMSLILV